MLNAALKSTTRQHFVHNSPHFRSHKRPKPPFCAHFHATRAPQTQGKQGIWGVDCEKLARKGRAILRARGAKMTPKKSVISPNITSWRC